MCPPGTNRMLVSPEFNPLRHAQSLNPSSASLSLCILLCKIGMLMARASQSSDEKTGDSTHEALGTNDMQYCNDYQICNMATAGVSEGK